MVVTSSICGLLGRERHLQGHSDATDLATACHLQTVGTCARLREGAIDTLAVLG